MHLKVCFMGELVGMYSAFEVPSDAFYKCRVVTFFCLHATSLAPHGSPSWAVPEYKLTLKPLSNTGINSLLDGLKVVRHMLSVVGALFAGL